MTRAADARSAVNRTMVLIAVLLATVMTILDSTIANVALPHMAGSLSASPDQITWVLTSYIISAAIIMPITGWLAGRIGTKRLFVVSIVGFTLASMLCGVAQSLEEIIFFRILQGMSGAVMGPLSQLVILELYSTEERSRVMSFWGLGTVMAPIVGPVLGGFLTETLDWRWVFYINVPIGVFSLLGIWVFMPRDGPPSARRFDILGFSLLTLCLSAAQLVLDRGQSQDWFQSGEIVVETLVAGTAALMFLVHILTAKNPIIPTALFRDRNFSTALILTFAMGALMFSILALLPTMLQQLMNFPVIATGLLIAPRGVGTMVSILIMGRLPNRLDLRLQIFLGLCLFGVSFYGLSHMSLIVDQADFVWLGVVLGLGAGVAFMPVIMLGYATLKPELRGDASGLTALIRFLGNSFGISILQTILTRKTQAVHAQLVEHVTYDNPKVQHLAIGARLGSLSTERLTALNAEITRQAAMVAYLDVFVFLFWCTLALLPAVLLLRPSEKAVPDEKDMGVLE